MQSELVQAQAGHVAGVTTSDEEIIARVLGGDPGLFELLMRRHNQRVYRTVRAILRRDDDCEDVMQQTYINAFVHLKQFQSHARFSTWLTRIAVNAAIQRGHRLDRGPEVHLPDDAAATLPTTDPDPEHATYAGELSALLESAVDALPAPYRVVFALREIEGMSTAETAVSLEINEDTVKTRLHRAKVHLRRQIVQRLGVSTPQIYAFHLTRCDRVVTNVLSHLRLSNDVE